MERFGKPGKTMLGSDSHTCAAGSLGMLAIGTGGLEVALAMAGEPFFVKMPKVMGVKLTGDLPDWVSAKDVILEMLRRHGVKGGVGKVIEYYGPGLKNLTAMDRHVIANMGAELGATTTVFPSDEGVKRFLRQQKREEDWKEIVADEDAEYDEHDEINLSELESLIAKPGSPGNVVPVREVEGVALYQAYIGSSANPGMRDFAIPAMMIDGRQSAQDVSLDINPTSRQILENLIQYGCMGKLIKAGARLHQAGCNGCIGMGQAPASGKNSLRTVPRNFPGRSGTKEDSVFLCSPEVEIKKGPNIKPLPHFDELPDRLEIPVLIKTGDNVSTDEIMPAGAKVLPYRRNIPEISKFVFYQIDEHYYERAMEYQKTGSIIIGGENYGQGSSREHAAVAARYLGVRAVIAKSFARIHWQNLANFGILPLQFSNKDDWQKIKRGDFIIIDNIREQIKNGTSIKAGISGNNMELELYHQLTKRQVEMVWQGSLINVVKKKH